MPHKRNPILSERIAGLARLLRGYAQTALENQPLWHERDISHSSAERVILPDATILLDYMLVKIDGPRRGARRPAGADAREHRARPRPPRLVARPARARRAGRAVARGGLRDRPARRAPRRRRAGAAPRAPGDRPGRRPQAPARRRSTPASTTRRSSATCPRSSPDSTRSRPGSRPVGRHAPEGGRRCRSLTRSSAPARSATCTDRRRPAAARRVGPAVARSTSSCRRRSRTRAACSPGLSRFWFRETASIVPNHLLVDRPADVPADVIGGDPDVGADLRGRMMLGRLPT